MKTHKTYQKQTGYAATVRKSLMINWRPVKRNKKCHTDHHDNGKKFIVKFSKMKTQRYILRKHIIQEFSIALEDLPSEKMTEFQFDSFLSNEINKSSAKQDIIRPWQVKRCSTKTGSCIIQCSGYKQKKKKKFHWGISQKKINRN